MTTRRQFLASLVAVPAALWAAHKAPSRNPCLDLDVVTYPIQPVIYYQRLYTKVRYFVRPLRGCYSHPVRTVTMVCKEVEGEVDRFRRTEVFKDGEWVVDTTWREVCKPGQPRVSQLLRDMRINMLPPSTKPPLPGAEWLKDVVATACWSDSGVTWGMPEVVS